MATSGGRMIPRTNNHPSWLEAISGARLSLSSQSDPEGVLSDGFEGDPVTGVYFGKVACRWEDGISGGSE
ncbi:hypothetical protein B296_00022721 [Ensete ventricosum]|uniref:Uncharacterized protein n=1 Tax=Ensete ventricosum TaxID=4639 RepID=A0A426YTB7_ENSVE|nr:hypothetical protein B296_00022721 [Ensete ventricosum]